MGAENPVEASRNDVLTAAAAHAAGGVLFAVAEGDAARQPDEATLGHIFGCPRCSATVREMRAGLAAFAVAPRSGPAGDVPSAATAPAIGSRPSAAAPSDPKSAASAAAMLLAASEPAAAAGDDGGAARRMICKLAVVGSLLAAALWWMRSFADGLR